MIHLDSAESVISDHVARCPHDPSHSDDSHPRAENYYNSEAPATEIPHSASDINIKIVDFGVGM